jgi:hypothetical protein
MYYDIREYIINFYDYPPGLKREWRELRWSSTLNDTIINLKWIYDHI